MPSQPLNADDVRTALTRLSSVAVNDVTGSLDAALHLALPAASLPREVHDQEDSLIWRGARVAKGPDPVETSCTLARLGWRETDDALNLRAPAWTWLKRLPRGSRIHLIGTTALISGPAVTIDSSIPPCADEQVFLALIQGLQPPLLMTCRGKPFVIETRRSGAWRVDPLEQVNAPQTDPDAAAQVIAERCHAHSWVLDEHTLRLTVDGGVIHVPWQAEGAVHVDVSPVPWWDTGTGEWTALGVDHLQRVWVRHRTGIRGWWADV